MSDWSGVVFLHLNNISLPSIVTTLRLILARPPSSAMLNHSTVARARAYESRRAPRVHTKFAQRGVIS